MDIYKEYSFYGFTRIENKLIKKMNAFNIENICINHKKITRSLEDTISVFDDSEIKNETPI